MTTLIYCTVASVWKEVSIIRKTYKTPSGVPYSVCGANINSITIKTSRNHRITISREQFHEALRFLIANGHIGKNVACEIRANISEPGPLDSATRAKGNGTMVIPYILPILASTGIVGIDGKRPNKTWINL